MTNQGDRAGRRRVLVVDDDPAYGESLAPEMASRDYDVEIATTPDQAVAMVAHEAPALVVLDLHLSGGGALALLRRWKVEHPDLVVVLVSGNASLPGVVEALQEGASQFFRKPVAASALLDELAHRHSVREATAANHQLSSAALEGGGVDRFFAISPGLLSIAGFDGYFKLLNPAWEEALGYTVDELCARPYIELVHPEDRDKAIDEAIEIRGGATVFRYKNRYRCKDGSYRWLTWSATPSPADGLIYASARDVTTSVRLEQSLEAANQRLRETATRREHLLRESLAENESLVELGLLRDETASMIVHDLKNPLSVILANYEYVLDAFDGSTDCMEALADSHQAGRRMVQLLGNLADVARLEKGTFELKGADVNLVTLLRDVTDQRRVLARTRRIEIDLVSNGPVHAWIDVELVTRILENIIDNALRYTPSGGTIQVEVHDAGLDAQLRIGNSGPAIPVELRESIFGKFERGAETARVNLGLGLYFSRLAIALHGGAIWIEESEMLPAVFAIRIPHDAARALPGAPEAHHVAI